MRQPAAFVGIIVLSVVTAAVTRWQPGPLALLGVRRRIPSMRRCPWSNADYLQPALSSVRQASLVLAAIVVAVAVSGQGGLRPPSVEASTTSPLVLGVLLGAPNREVATNTGTIWSKTLFPSQFSCCDLLLPRPITDKSWFLMGFWYQLDFNSSVVLWTPNAGSNWYTYTTPAPNQHWQDFAADASGRLWGLTLDTSSPNYWGDAKIWRSDNGGITWSQSDHEIGTSSDPIMLYRLATNPIDPNQVIAYGRHNPTTDARVTVVSQDGGGSWMRIEATSHDLAFANGQESDIQMMPSGRLVVAGERAPGSSGDSIVSTSDDLGQSWTVRKDFGSGLNYNLGPVGRLDGTKLFVAHVDDSVSPKRTEVWYSTDGGTTWNAFTNVVPEYNGNFDGRGGIAYDEPSDAVYVANSGGLQVNEKLVMRMSPADPNGTWQDNSYNLVPFGSFTSYDIADFGQAIAAAPGPSIYAAPGAPGDHPNQPFSGEPVNLFSGNFWHQHTDITIPTNGIPLEFTRSYSSSDPNIGSLGAGWSFNYGMQLLIDRSDPAQTRVTRISETGGRSLFTQNPDGTYASPPELFETLLGNPDGTFALTRKNQVSYTFSSAGKLTTITDRNQNSITLHYDPTSGLLDKAFDSANVNRFLQFGYDTSSRITTVADSVPSPDTHTVQFFYDANGDLVKVKDLKSDPTNGPFTVYVYDSIHPHHLKSLTDTNGHTATQDTYDAGGRVAEQLDAVGGVTCIYYGSPPSYSSPECLGTNPAPATGQTVLVDPRGSKTTYNYDSLGRTTSVIDDIGAQASSYTYGTDGNRSCLTEHGNKTGYVYNSSGKGNVAQIIDAANTDANCNLKPGGVSRQYSYTSLNDVSQSIDPLGNVTDYTYDSVGNLTRVVRRDAGGAVKALTCFTRDGAGKVTALVESTDLALPPGSTDPCTGHKTQLGYDQSGDLTSMINPRFDDEPNADPDGDSLVLTATSTSGPCSTSGTVQPKFRNCIENFVGTDPARACAATTTANDEPVDSMPVDFNDDRSVNVTDRTLMELALKNFNYNPAETVAAAIAAADTTISVSSGGAAGIQNGHTINIDNELMLVTAGGGTTTLTVTRAQNGTTAASHSVGALINHHQLRFDLNADFAINATDRTIVEIYISKTGGLPCSTTTAPPAATFTYDPGGRLLTATDELGHTTTYTYDNFNMLKTQKDNLNNTTTYTYDAKGNLQTITDANSPPGVTQYSYDPADQLTLVIDALGHKTTYSYDANGNLATVTDPNRQTVSNPESGTAQCGAKLTGNNVDDDGDGFKDDGCPSTIYTYDALNRVSSMTDSLGRITSYQYPAYNVRRVTDPRGIVTTSTWTPSSDTVQASTGESVTDNYDAAGNRYQMIDGTGTTLYGYDGLNRLSSVTYPGNKVVGYQYDAVGNSSRITYPGTTGYVTYGYNADHTMSSAQQSWGSVGATSYTYDNAGNLQNATLPNNVSTAYGYDNADRLASVVNSQPGTPPTTMSTYTYTLDAVGNRTGMTGTGGPQTYQYDALNRLKQATYPGSTDNYTYDPNGNRLTKNSTTYAYTGSTDQMSGDGSVSYIYDPNGNLQTRGSDTFTFNYANRLTGATVGGVTSSSTYNGDGLRMSHTANSQTGNYIWDMNRSVPEILQDGTNTYVYGLGLISSTDGSGVQTYYDADGLGSTSDLTDSSHTKTDGYTYDAFGTPTHSPGSSANPFQFTGQQRDTDSGLQYLRARYYDPGTGRFLSQDPIPGGNPYTYAGNDPTTYTDPSGACKVVVGAHLLDDLPLGFPSTFSLLGFGPYYHLYITTYDPTNGSSVVNFAQFTNGLPLPPPIGNSTLHAYDVPAMGAPDTSPDDPQVTVFDNNGSCNRIRSKLNEKEGRINAATRTYDPLGIFGPNSNSAVHAELDYAGLPAKLPQVGCSGPLLGPIWIPNPFLPNPFSSCPVDVPGWDTDIFN